MSANRGEEEGREQCSMKNVESDHPSTGKQQRRSKFSNIPIEEAFIMRGLKLRRGKMAVVARDARWVANENRGSRISPQKLICIDSLDKSRGAI